MIEKKVKKKMIWITEIEGNLNKGTKEKLGLETFKVDFGSFLENGKWKLKSFFPEKKKKLSKKERMTKKMKN